ncbi:Mitochondrial ATPase complex subunit atp10 [Coemansia sp. RSA 2703]|nr:Mitochondrial ATPase complex subunit atp10 [Coemansia sp. RSA 2703]KAJ2366065.1 Mitochondrial ATPase complex subunit atp10 [Coemansia sp. RSA 2607]KAJ2386052.1 Mitochondrial ATPase complex subunit atp10 [Coemansia sp. RSA 2603]
MILKNTRLTRPLLSHGAFARNLHSSRALCNDTPSAKDKPEVKPAEQEAPATEKIEYIGNTRFPRPRPKPRKTIRPGEAVGQQTPAGKLEHKPLKQKIDEKWRDILSPEKNLETRAKIIKEITESHWQNILDLRNNGEKLFEAPSDLISAATARYLPNLEGNTLTGDSADIVDLCRGKTTLLTIEFTKFAEKHTLSYINLFEKVFGDNEKAQVVQVNIEENWAKAAVLRLCLPYVRRSIPKPRHPRYVVHYGGVEGLRNTLGIANPLIGYAFLVDPKTRIRWYANGEAVQSEGTAMLTLTEALLRKTK